MILLKPSSRGILGDGVNVLSRACVYLSKELGIFFSFPSLVVCAHTHTCAQVLMKAGGIFLYHCPSCFETSLSLTLELTTSAG